MLIAVGLAVILLFFAFRGVDWGEMFDTLLDGDPLVLLVAFGVLFVSVMARGLRWVVLLRAERPVRVLTGFWGVNTGYLGNAFLPARAGELIRSTLMARYTGINIGFVLATAATERILDVVVLIILGASMITPLPNPPEWLINGLYVMVGVGVVGLLALIFAPRFREPLLNLVRRLPLPDGLKQSLVNLLDQVLTGMTAFQNTRRLLMFLSLTVMIWSLDMVFGLTVAAAFGFSAEPNQILLLLAALGLSSAVPSTPGYVGVYQFVAVGVLTPFGWLQSEALVLIITYQLLSYIFFVIFGTLGIWRLNIGVSPAAEAQPIAET